MPQFGPLCVPDSFSAAGGALDQCTEIWARTTARPYLPRARATACDRNRELNAHAESAARMSPTSPSSRRTAVPAPAICLARLRGERRGSAASGAAPWRATRLRGARALTFSFTTASARSAAAVGAAIVAAAAARRRRRRHCDCCRRSLRAAAALRAGVALRRGQAYTTSIAQRRACRPLDHGSLTRMECTATLCGAASAHAATPRATVSDARASAGSAATPLVHSAMHRSLDSSLRFERLKRRTVPP